MKCRIIVIMFVVFSFWTRVDAKGVIPIIYSEGEDIVKVMSLPDKEEFMLGSYHADLGIHHEQFSLFYIPLYNYGVEKYVLFAETKDDDYLYYELSNEEVKELQSQFSGISTKPELPFWDAWGGKLLALIIIALLFFWYRS